MSRLGVYFSSRDNLGALVAIALCALLCANGIWWGSVEIWNADQMAFKDQFREDALPFSPEHFDKPPLYSYINFAFSVVPRVAAEQLAGHLLPGPATPDLTFISVWLAKLLQLILACASVWFLSRIVARAFNPETATTSAFLLATSAGLIAQAHLITTDLPVVFFMVLSFWACQRIQFDSSLRTYVIAGICIGLTAAMKYNGLVVGLALPVFHLLKKEDRGLLARVFAPKLICGLVCVPLGFFIGNPFAFFEFDRFWNDLTYLFTTSPEFIGASGEVTREVGVVATLIDNFLGLPLGLILLFAIPFACFYAARHPLTVRGATVAAALGIAAFYGWYFASRTNVQVRWLLALVPMLLIASAPFWQHFFRSQYRAAVGFAALLTVYGAVCSTVVGLRFAWDPRYEAIAWLNDNVTESAVIESSSYLPEWPLHLDIEVKNERMPNVSGRGRIFQEAFKHDPHILAELSEREKENVPWYTIPALQQRAPDYVALSSLYIDRFHDGTVASAYPEISYYFKTLLSGSAGYEIVLDVACCEVNWFLYPKTLLFVDNRVIILKRRAK